MLIGMLVPVKELIKVMAVVYLIMGVLFTFFAFRSADETVWNPLTIGLLLIAALDFLVAMQLIRKSFQKNDGE